MSAATSKWAVLGDLIISVTSQGTVIDSEFQVFLQELRKPQIKKYFNASLGKPESTSLQRKQIAEVLKSRDIRTATVTEDAVVRGFVTAIGWLGANIRAFTWTETKAAIQYLEVPEPFATRAVELLSKLRREVEAERR